MKKLSDAPTTRRYARSLADAFADVRANAVEGPYRQRGRVLPDLTISIVTAIALFALAFVVWL